MDQIYSTRSGHRVSGAQFDSYHSLTDKELSASQQMVINAFDGAGAKLTREEISRRTNMKLSGVCGRVRELLDAKRLVVCGSIKDLYTGKPQELLKLAAEPSNTAPATTAATL
ncbi:MarR family transcriptional regulator [Cupriavidus oxalaticus]|uniref:MarR family transcriptional regulator n=1 Tax=Cupriavidus oxalaticus TaxID=96344 RepID=A0A976BFR4_9BURK|nr:MarR family transcriptional regulator [Cupriavidus oxalaticus]QRQ86277.1 MarR family transcriptional regulator [Cupriavidus oxalaticus]QRQ95396.1 MarR family transcriptional regulator [Cupriavidus oxalaticus]WQD84052.1 MarR family transcriptional regulator [Cupriavidus oxalaticus]SPC17365.1 conserved hypothetical protein [Cupriavidus oxalaticus]